MIDPQQAISVSSLTHQIKQLFEEKFPDVVVRGEISNFTHHRSGHMYFTIKDNRSECRCVMFRGYNQYIHFKPQDGMQVLLGGPVSVYEPRGIYQIMVQSMEPAGVGTLYLAYEALKKQLSKEGLFSKEFKKDLPKYPKTIGVITSEDGAALSDILQILKRRSPYVEIFIRPTLVQGEKAADDIVNAIQFFEDISDIHIDLIILGRGGGSLEDLWSFNEEKVARAVYSCGIPIISAVGHETDITITDLVADVRAATPSAAAELAAPALADLVDDLARFSHRFSRGIQVIIDQWWQKLDQLTVRCNVQSPAGQIRRRYESLSIVRQHLIQVIEAIRLKVASEFGKASGKLETLNPQGILHRGYSIVYQLPEKTIIKSHRDVITGSALEVQTATGVYYAEKTESPPNTDKS
jgi:exodeoxyribonuclease VII large subunit